MTSQHGGDRRENWQIEEKIYELSCYKLDNYGISILQVRHKTLNKGTIVYQDGSFNAYICYPYISFVPIVTK